MTLLETYIIVEDTIPAFCAYASRALKGKYFGKTKIDTRLNSADKYGNTFSPKDKLLYGYSVKEMIGKKLFREKAILFWEKNYNYDNNNFIKLLDKYLSGYSEGGGLL